MVKNETTYEIERPFDPVEPPAHEVPEPFELAGEAEQWGFAPLSEARQWLYKHRNLNMHPAVERTGFGPVWYGTDELQSLYPGVASKISESQRKGYSDNQIMANIIDRVDRSLLAGYSDSMIVENLFYGDQKDYGFTEKWPYGDFFYGRPRNWLEKTWDYLGTTPDYETSPIRHEIRAVAERGLSSLTIGLSDAIQEEEARPKTVPGILAGSAAELVGFLKGPLKVSRHLIGGRLAPTATGLRGIAQVMNEGGARLSLARGLSEIVPAFEENESFTEAGVQIIESAGLSYVVGSLYPLSGAIPSKPLRLSVGLAVLDLIRGKGEFTIDDVITGVADGTIDRDELAQRSFGYLMDLYFLNRVPTMKKQLAGLERNAMVRKMLECNADETESVILQLRKANLIPGNPENFLGGLSKWDKVYAFGSTKEFNAAYKLVIGEQAKLAKAIQAEIEGKVTIRIPKDLQPLAAKARTFRKPTNFENALKWKLSEGEKVALQKTTKGDLKRFWKGVAQRDLLEKQSTIQHKSESEKFLDAMKTEIMYNQADTELQRLSDGKIRKVYQGVARAVWDTSNNIKAKLLKDGGVLGKEALMRHDLIRGAGPKATRIIQEAADRVYSGLTKAEQITLDRIIQSRRTVAIEKYRTDIKHPAGLGLKEHQAYQDTIPRKTFKRLNERAKLYFAEMDSQLKQLYEAGIINRESYTALLQTGDYSPRRFIQHIDTERSYTFGGKKITVWDSGIKALDEGSYRVMENNSRALLAQVVTRTQARIFRNEANKALFELAKQLPDNQIVKLSEITKVTKDGKPIYQKPPAGYERLGVMIDGQLKEMLMPNSLAKEWVPSDPAISSQMANIVGWISGAKLLRPMATGLNPEFALTNLPRDIAHAWITTHEYSPHLPIAAGQMLREYAKTAPESFGVHPIKGARSLLAGKDYKTVWSDTFNRRGAWLDYINEGGGMSFLTHQGRVTRKTTGKLAGLQNVLGYLGETSEIWTRLALRERALRNGKPPHEATWIARSYLDFSLGGSFIKGADTAVPYLNAGVQGTRGIFRAAKEKPGELVYKMAEIGTLATGLYLANKYRNPECWEAVSPHDKTNYFIITTPLTYQDDEGNTRHLYFRVAKDQGQRLITTLFEQMMGKYLGDEIDVDQLTQAAREIIRLAPPDLLPPTMDAALGYYANKDFWRNEDIWKGPEVAAQEEYRAYTHPAFVKIGEVTGMSPERTRHALQQYFTYGNIYTSLVGGGLGLIMDELPEDVKGQATQDMLTQAPFLRRVLKATNPYTQYQKEIETAKIDEQTRRYKQSRTLDALSEQYYGKEIDQQPIKAFINKQPWQDRERLVQRHQRYGRLYEIPDRRWWLNLMDMPPETSATVYWTRWQQADKTEKKRLDKYLRQVPGVITEKFMLRLNQLKAKK